MTGLDILVVDANRTVRRIVEQTLRAEGHRVLGFESGAEALRAAEQARPALVLVDLRGAPADVATELGGHGLRRAFARSDTLRDVPFVTMSVRTAEDGSGRAEGVQPDTLQKPFSPETLLAALAGALTRSRDADRFARRERQQDPRPTEGPIGLESSLGADDALVGRVEHVSLADVLQLLSAQRQSGTLELRGEALTVAIGLARGQVDLAMGAGPEATGLRLGRLLLEEGVVSRGALDEALAAQGSARRQAGYHEDPANRLGAILVAHRAITADVLSRSLARQTTDLVALALRVPRGTFRFARLHVRHEAAEARLGLPLSPLVLEGLRRLDEWRLLEARVRSLDVVLARHEAALESVGDDVLHDGDRRVLGRLDGSTPLRDLAEPEVAAIASRLLTLGVARVAGDD